MITKLTKEQELRLPELVEKWVALGLCTDAVDLDVARNIARNVDREILGKNRLVVVTESPIACWMAVCMFSQVWSQVQSQVWSQVESQVQSQVWDFIWPYFSGHWWAQYFAWVETMKVIGVIGITKKYNVLEDCNRLGLFYPLEHVLIVGSRPCLIVRNSAGQLHKDQGPALSYRDGCSIYALNGIRMKPEYVLTPAEQIEPETVLAETNADIRRELIRKVGIERMLSKLPHKTLDKSGTYELLSVDLGSGVRDARFLKMLNASIGVWHLEGEPPEINTVEKALNRRNQNWFTHAEQLT